MHCQWQSLNATVSSPVHRLWCLIAQRTLLGGRYTGDGEQWYNSNLFSCKVKWNYGVTVQWWIAYMFVFEIINLTFSAECEAVYFI